jgi:hypothetical protein
MILLIVGRGVRRPLGLAAGHVPGPAGVRVLEPSGLSTPGWAHDPENPAEDRLVIDGEVQPAGRLTAVITGLDAVQPFDLPDVRAEDRAFVASEMTAFLRTWLGTLTCPVLDRPTALALSGAAGDHAVWSKAAAALAVPDCQATPAPRTRTHAVTVAAGRVVGPAPEPAAATALALTRVANVTAARLRLTDDAREPAFCEAVPWWHAPSPASLRVLLAHARELS